MAGFLKLLAVLALVLSSEASPRRYHYGTPRKSGFKPVAAPDYRLSQDVTPTGYTVDLKLAKDFTTTKVFTGTVVINFSIDQAMKSFKIHMQDIEINGDINLKDSKNADVAVTTTGPDAETNFFTITSSGDDLAKDTYILTIAYTGHLSETDMDGFYLSTYKDGDTVKYLATTQFEEMGARRAFPCFDEPALKATFDISITYPTGYKAMSNTKGADPIADPDDADLEKVVFPTTPSMSTYLVAFIVSEFDCSPGETVDNIPTEVCSRGATKDYRGTAVTTGSQILTAMHDYTGIPFNTVIGKLSQAAIPDFAAGAMENWGMVTYREADLLWEDGQSSSAYKQSIATVIAHELSHQWFGDTVTLTWWSDIFLNEGFATYFEYYAADYNHKDWELPKQFVLEQLQAALLADSTDTALPLHYTDADDPNSISSRFDDISYSKGGSVLRMVHHLLGLDVFKAGLNAYVSNSIGKPETLWGSFDSLEGGLPEDLPDTLTKVMENWVNKPGYPLLTVSKNGDNVTIKQEAFVLSGTAPTTKWYVPITYTLPSKTGDFAATTTKAWLTPDADLTISDLMKDQKWIVLNNQQTGYYRVSYDKSILDQISTALNADDFSSIDEISRSQIVDDLLNLARSGKKEYSEVLKFLGFLKKDDSYYPWYSAFNGFNYLLQRTADASVRKALTTYVTNLMDALHKSTPIESVSDKQIFNLKQVLALTWACKLGVKDCLDPATKQFADYVADATKIPPPNLRSIVYCNGLRNSKSTDKDYEFLWGEYKKSELATEKITLLKTLGCSNDKAVRTKYLAMALTEDVRIQDITYVFSSVYSNNPGGVDDVLDFIKDKYKDFKARFGDNRDLNNLISAVGSVVTTQAQIDKLTTFSKVDGLDADVKTSATDAITTAKANLDVTKKLETKLKAYFNLNDAPSSASMNSYHFINVAFVLVGYILYNFY